MDLKVDGINVYDDEDGKIVSVTVHVMRDEYRCHATTYVELQYSDALTIHEIHTQALNAAKEKLKLIASSI